jgi:hypothetical protein
MIWNKPRNVGQWLLVLLPAVLAIIASQIAKWELPPVPPLHLANGREIPNLIAGIKRVSVVALEVITATSTVVALIFSKGPQLGERIVNAFLLTLFLVFVNGFVAFAGCSFTGTLNPTPQELAPAYSGGVGNDATSRQSLPAGQYPAAR